jgi:alcohol dehydrogenase, propanol-preferring
MASTYKAVEVAAPGNLRIVERLIPQPGEGQVLIQVKACGICYTDSFTVEGQFPGLHLPRVPGHEVAGASKRLVPTSLNGMSGSESASAFSVLVMDHYRA